MVNQSHDSITEVTIYVNYTGCPRDKFHSYGHEVDSDFLIPSRENLLVIASNDAVTIYSDTRIANSFHLGGTECEW